MTVFGPETTFLLCRKLKKGFGYKQQCLGSDFRIYSNGSFSCASCGTIYESIEALQIANRVNTEPSLFEERLAVNG
jgi:adenine-specific DNA methylase